MSLRKRLSMSRREPPDGGLMDQDQEQQDIGMVQKRTSLTAGGAGIGGDDGGHHHESSTDSNHLTSSSPPLRRSLDEFLEEAIMASSSSSSSSSQSSLSSSASCVKNAHHWRYWLVFISLGVANSSDATEILCISYILSNADFDDTILYHSSAWRAGMLAAAVFLGMLLGGLWVGVAGDARGRRPMLLLGLSTNAISGMLSALSINIWMLTLLRFLSGLGIGATVPPLFTLCSELAPAHDRGFWVSVAASFWMVGSIYVAVVAWALLEEGLNWSWRGFALACALPSAVGFSMVYQFVPESPRFLALQGNTRQSDAALGVVRGLAWKLQYTGSEWSMEELLHQYPLATAPQQERESSLRMERSWTHSMKYFFSSVELLYVPQLRQTTLPLQMVWFSLSFGSYGLMTWINTLFVKVHLQNVYWNALLFALSNLPGNLLSVTLMDRTGRSSLLIGSILASALSLVAFAYVAAIDNDDNNEKTLPRGWIVLTACSFQCFGICAWNAIDVMTSELFPTKVRSTGMGICAATGRIAAMLAQFINGATVQHPTLLLLIAAVTLGLGAATPALLPRGADKTGQVMADNVGSKEQGAESMTSSTSTSVNQAASMMPSGQQSATSSSAKHHYDPLRIEDPRYQREVV